MSGKSSFKSEAGKNLIKRGIECAKQFGWRYAVSLIFRGGFKRHADDVYTVSELNGWRQYGKKTSRSVSSALQSTYDYWMDSNEEDITEAIVEAASLKYRPLFSIVVPVYNVQREMLKACIESVRSQAYDKWELILVDDCSTMKEVRDCLSEYENKNISGIHIVYRDKNGNISEATNEGLKYARGEFIVFCDCDDVIDPNALYENAKLLNKNPELDFIYSDEDKLTQDGSRRHDPFFKPDWSPDTFMSMMYTNHLGVYRARLVRKTGGLRSAYDGSQDYDFTLRFMELTDNRHVGHIPKVLYHWREREESAASSAEAKPYAIEVMRQAKDDALKRRNIRGYTQFVPSLSQYRVVYECPGHPLVSIVIPSKDNYEMLKRCIVSITKHTSYPNYEIILVDNGSGQENRKKTELLCARYKISYIYEKMEFNFSRMCNIGVTHSHGAYILFLNDDTEAVQDKWLSILAAHAAQPWVGAVGAKLLYPDSRLIQHDGIINRKSGPVNVLEKQSDRNNHYFGRNVLEYNYCAVTGACLMVSREKFLSVGGMDEALSVTYNDVDMCWRLYESGLYNVVRNDVVLFHYESASRGNDIISKEKMDRLCRERMMLYEKHPLFRDGSDPFYSINFAPDTSDFRIHYSQLARVISVHTVNPYRGYTKVYKDIHFSIDESIEAGPLYKIRGFVLDPALTPVLPERYLILESRTGEIVKIPLNRTPRADVRLTYGGRSAMVGFDIYIQDSLLHRERTDYRLALFLSSGGVGRTVYIPTGKTIPRREYRLSRRVAVPLLGRTSAGKGVHIQSVNRTGSILQISGWMEDFKTLSMACVRFLMMDEGGVIKYYKLFDYFIQSFALKYTKIPFAGYMGFRGRIYSRGKVTGILVWDMEKQTQTVYPVSEKLLREQERRSGDYWNRISDEELKRQRERTFSNDVKFSILVPLFNTPVTFLKEMIGSVLGQTYGNWELCIADGSDEDHADPGRYCEDQAGSDSRIRYQKLKRNGGISENTNACMRMSKGDFIVLLDHDDLLARNALYEMMAVLEKNHDSDILYSDEDKVNEDSSKYFDPNFKPAFNLDLLRSDNYICHLFAVKKAVAEEAGPMRTSFNGSQDYDFILRCVEKAHVIAHIPKVLYHWRTHSGSTALSQGTKSYASEAGRRAVEEHLRREGIDAEVEVTANPGLYRVKYALKGQPLVSIIIKSGGAKHDAKECEDTIREKTAYKNYEILTETADARGEYAVYIDPTIRVKTGEWLDWFVSNCQRREVEAVCGKCVDARDVIISCGRNRQVVGSPDTKEYGNGSLHELFHGVPLRSSGYFGRASVQQAVDEVYEGCYMIRNERVSVHSSFAGNRSSFMPTDCEVDVPSSCAGKVSAAGNNAAGNNIERGSSENKSMSRRNVFIPDVLVIKK